MSTAQLTPSTSIQYLKGVGPRLAQILQKKAIYTAWDLLFYLPIKYVDRRKIYNIRELPIDKKQTFLAEVVKLAVRPIRRRGKGIFEITVKDSTGVATISFFQYNESYLRGRYAAGTKVMFFGDVGQYRGVKNMVHPEMELWEEDDGPSQKIYPFYSLTEGLYQKTIRKIISQNLEALLDIVHEDPLSVRDSGEVQISLKDAFRYVHEPPLEADVDLLNEQQSPFHQRLIYDEFFYLQLGLISKRYKQSQNETHKIVNERKLYNKVIKDLPFLLTGDQLASIEDVKDDFASGKPMNRMLQGDVGSGKTMVAFLSALMAIESGFQVALMAPTEILAEQHFKNLFPYEEKLGVRMELLLGSTKTKKREQILYDLDQGMTQLLIGTHALITPDVLFRNLGYVVIDEQHRFGVMQRAQLKNKAKFKNGEVIPHLLVMTATPIPRSLSMCVYGDLDLSIIREMPKGRKPIKTKVFREKQREKMYEMVRGELQKKRQAYFVYPLVAESEKLDLKDATLMHAKLTKEFAGHQVGLLHGKMKSAEKEAIMASYKAGEIEVLVATTVVEVGVDVANATIMVIEHAERFGLSQLHQLRGRVGRGAERSYCFLMASYAQSQESRFRLKVMEETNDGFTIAEEDLKLRGPGEFLGTKQSGMPDFRLAQIIRDNHLLLVAKNRAEEILKRDPELDSREFSLMRQIMLERWGKRLDLTLV
jgi:ATP-dependent DNA helicase RecG